MIRIFLAVFGVMVVMCTIGGGFAKHHMPFKTFAAVEQSGEGAVMLAQNRGEGNNNRQGCRRDRPPLSS